VKFTIQASGALGEVDHRRDRAQREADAAGADRLLAEDPAAERDALVDRAPLEPADADRHEHEVGALERVVEVGGRAERHVVAVLGRLSFEHERDPLQPAGVDVVQDDIVERLPAEQGTVDERDAEPSAPDDREPHAARISAIPAAESSALGTKPRAGVLARQGP